MNHIFKLTAAEFSVFRTFIEFQNIYYNKFGKYPDKIAINSYDLIKDLLYRISLLEEFHEIKIDLENLLLDKLNVLNSKKADEYGLVFKNPILKIFYNPKRIIHELEKSILNVDKKEWV